jgi:cyclic-di-GMP phosphodiesterase TipF (flagellum assembly factor)
MPLITHALLYAGYAALAAFVGISLSSVGGASAAESFLGAIALFSAFAITHAAFTAAHAANLAKNTERRIGGETMELRAGHRELSGDLDAVSARLDSLDRIVGEIAHKQAEQLPREGESRMIEQIAEKLAGAMDAKIEEVRRLSAPPTPQKPLSRGPIDMVREALAENRVELHLQPVVTLPQRKTTFYEGFSRLRDETGRMILPQEFIPAAEAAGLMSFVDNALMFRCVQIVRKVAEKDKRIAIFCNLSPKGLADDLFFPQFYSFMRENADLAGSLIFEIPQEAFEQRTSVEARAMARLADLGFRFSMDRVTRIDQIDLADLERSGVRYLKMAGQTLLDQVVKQGLRPKSSITREIAAVDLASVCLRFAVEIIAERVETESVVRELLDIDIGLAQGHLFGPPRPIRDSLMVETAPPPGYLQDRASRS